MHYRDYKTYSNDSLPEYHLSKLSLEDLSND